MRPSPPQLEQHPDPNIFTSLPRSGTVRAARLLAEIGAPAAGFPAPEALTCLAGAAPRRRLQGPAPGVERWWWGYDAPRLRRMGERGRPQRDPRPKGRPGAAARRRASASCKGSAPGRGITASPSLGLLARVDPAH